TSTNFRILYLRNVWGTAENPIIIRFANPTIIGQNNGGSRNYLMWIGGYHWKAYGENKVTLKPRDIDTAQSGFTFGESHNFEINGFRVERCKAAFTGNPTTGGLRQNLIFRNLSAKNLITPIGGTSEFIYLGSTTLGTLGAAWYNNVLIEDCTADSLAGDFVQIAVTQNALIRRCHVTNYGLNGNAYHDNAFIIGGSSQAIIDSCTATNGTGSYVQVLGHGTTIIRNCIFTNGGWQDTDSDGIYMGKTNADTNALRVQIENVTMNGAARRNAIFAQSSVSSVSLCNVILTGNTSISVPAGRLSYYSDCNVPPPPPDVVIPPVIKRMKAKKTAPAVKLRKTR
ncbi:MAG: hypothetical protein ACRCR4_04640, partial [Thiotrichaceae bacterium]